jgi:hypothetical protein
MSKLQEKHSALKREYLAFKKLNFLTFFYVCGTFLPSHPGSGYESWDSIKFGSTALVLGIRTGFHAEPDPAF